MEGTLVILWDMYSGDRTRQKDYSLGDFNTALSKMQVVRELAWICGPNKVLEKVGMNLQKKNFLKHMTQSQ